MISSLEDQLASADEDRQKQLVLISSLRDQIGSANEDNQQQLVLIATLRDQIGSANEKSQQQLVFIGSLEDQIAVAEDESRKQLLLIASLEDQLASASEKNRKQLVLISSLEDQLASADEDRQKQLVLIASLRDQIGSADQEKQQQLVLIASLEDQIAVAKDESRKQLLLISSLEDRLASASEENQKQVVFISSLQDQLASADQAKQQQLVLIASLEDQVASANEKNQQQLVVMTALREALDTEEAARKAAEKQLLVIPELRQQISGFGSTIVNLREKLSGAESEATAAVKSLTDATAKIAELEEALRSIVGERNRLLAIVAELRSQLSDNQEQVAALTATHDAQTSSIEQQALELSALKARIEQLVLELKAAAEQAKRETERALAAESQNLKALEDIQALKIALGAETEKSDERQQLIDDYQLEIFSLEERIAALVKAKSGTDKEIEDLQARLSDLRSEHDTVRVEASEAQTGMIALTLKLDEKRREAENTLLLLAAAESAKARLEELLGDRESDVTSLTSQLEDVRQRLSASEFAHNSLSKSAQGVRQELEQVRKRAQQLESRRAASEAERDLLQANLESAMRERDTAQASLLALQSKNETGELEALLAEIVRKQQEAQTGEQAAKDQAEQFKRQAESLADALNETGAELNSIRQKNTQLEDQLGAAINQKEEVERSLLTKTAELATIQRLLNESGNKSDADQRQITLLNLQIAELRDQLAQLQASLELSKQKEAESQVQIHSLGSDLNAALARVAAEERRRRQLEEAERKRLEQAKLQLERYQSEFFGRLRDLLEGREGIEVAGDRFLFSSEVLFESGEAELSAEGKREIGEIASLILELASDFPKDVDWVLRVDGHTDDRTVLPDSDFDDNWELSQSRSLSVVRHLIEALNFPPDRLAATGFGEFRPLVPNQTAEARSRNRRIEFKLTEP